MPKLSNDTQALRRAHILDAAELCFARAGFHRTTMQDICKQARVSAGAVYVYFDSKEALIDGIVGRDRDDIEEQILGIVDAPDFFNGLEQALRCCVIEQPAHKPALFLEIGSEATRNPRIAAILSHCDTTLRKTLAELLRRARAANRIPAGHDETTIAYILALLADGLFFRRAIDPEFDASRITPAIMDMVTKLIGEDAKSLDAKMAIAEVRMV